MHLSGADNVTVPGSDDVLAAWDHGQNVAASTHEASIVVGKVNYMLNICWEAEVPRFLPICRIRPTCR